MPHSVVTVTPSHRSKGTVSPDPRNGSKCPQAKFAGHDAEEKEKEERKIGKSRHTRYLYPGVAVARVKENSTPSQTAWAVKSKVGERAEFLSPSSALHKYIIVVMRQFPC
jgi:hypothetical protein